MAMNNNIDGCIFISVFFILATFIVLTPLSVWLNLNKIVIIIHVLFKNNTTKKDLNKFGFILKSESIL